MLQRPGPYTVLASGVFALILSLGVARFSYTPMIPYMQEQTGMGEALAGWLAGWNYLGYLTGVFIVTRLHSIVFKDYCYRGGLILAVVTTLMMGFGSSPWLWGISRYLAGISSAAGLMLGSGLILNWLMRHNHRSELGLHFTGLGLGIVVGAIAVELAARSLSWQGQWLTLSALGLLLLIPAWFGLPYADKNAASISQHPSAGKPPTRTWLWLLQIAYLCAGFGYVINATFTVVIVEQQPALQGQGVLMWLLVGLAATPAPILWDYIARQLGYLRTIQLAFVMQIAGIILPVFNGTLAAAIVSAFLFGVTFIGIVSLVLTMVGIRYPDQPAQIMAKLTLGYSIAQIIGPVVAGEAAELTGSFNGSLLMVGGFMLAGLICLQLMMRVKIEM